jgi:two-component system, cell cycle sensor histidine kinase PleC
MDFAHAQSSVAAPDGAALTAGHLVLAIPAFSPSMTCGDVFAWLQANPDPPAVPIVDDNGHVVGLVNRLMFLARYARQYAPELFSKKTILKLALTDPLLVDESVGIADLSATLLTVRPDAINECFVVTSRGRYLGLGTAETMMRAKLQLLESRGRELSTALDQAQQASTAKSSFLALMSHELRTPLNAILGFSEVIGSEVFGPVVPRYRNYAQDIHGAGKHLLALINDILDLSKAEAGKLELDCEAVNLGEVIKECARLMQGRAADQDLRLRLSIAALPPMNIDRLRVKQILLNLLSNAIKFTPNGGTISLEADRQPDGGVSVRVRDTGIGMAPEMIPLVFEPFRQVDSDLSHKFEGTGLGLSLVKLLIEQHGGSVGIESALGKGSCVTLRLPAARCLETALAKTA